MDKRFLVRMQICLSLKEYARKRRPYFVRFIDMQGKQRHEPVESYDYSADCVLTVTFHHDQSQAHPVQTPVVCFDPTDDEDEEEMSYSTENMHTAKGYMKVYGRVAQVRDELAEHFPECKQMDIGFMDTAVLAFVRLRGSFVVAVSSDPGVPIFAWDKRFLIPFDKATPKLGEGFKVAMHLSGSMLDVFWYKHSGNVPMFTSVDRVVRYADANCGQEKRIEPERHIRTEEVSERAHAIGRPHSRRRCVQIIASSDLIHARLNSSSKSGTFRNIDFQSPKQDSERALRGRQIKKIFFLSLSLETSCS